MQIRGRWRGGFAVIGSDAGAFAVEGARGTVLSALAELASCGLADAFAVLLGANERKYATMDFTSLAGATSGGIPPAFMVAFGAWMSLAICASESFVTKPLIGGIYPAPAPASP